MRLSQKKITTYTALKILAHLTLYIIFKVPTQGQVTSTTGSGIWSTGSNWSNSVPDANRSVVVSHTMTLPSSGALTPGANRSWFINAPLLSVAGSTLSLSITNDNSFIDFRANARISNGMTVGTSANQNPPGRGLLIRSGASVTVSGNVLFDKSSYVLIEPGGELIVFGNLTNSVNSDNITISGLLRVSGALNNDNNGVIVGTGNIVAGSINNGNASSTIYGSNSNCASNCNITAPISGCLGTTFIATASQTVCSGSSPTIFTALLTVPGTASGFGFIWQTFSNGNWVSASGANNVFTSISGTVYQSTYQADVVSSSCAFRAVVSFSGCTSQVSNQIAISIGNAGPANVPTFNSSRQFCRNASSAYNVTLSGALSYVWSVPSGIKVVSGQNEASALLSFSGSALSLIQISVAGVNSCNVGAYGVYNLSLNGTNNWTGASSTTWNTINNWCFNSIPSATQSVVIPSGLTNYPIASGLDIEIVDLNIQPGASLQVINSTLRLNGSLSSFGVFSTTGLNTLLLKGGNQSISSSNILQLQNLSISGSGTKFLTTPVLIYGQVGFDQVANLDVGVNNLALKSINSSLTGTARIGTIPSGTSVIGQVLVEKYISGKRAIRHISVPVSGAKVSDWQKSTYITGPTGCIGCDASLTRIRSVQTYDETFPGTQTGGYVVVTNTGQDLVSGRGYHLFTRGSRLGSIDVISPSILAVPTVLSVTGTLTQGNFSLPLSFTPSPFGFTADGWNFAGNPYPSPVDLSHPSVTRSGLTNAFYIWNSNEGTAMGAYYTCAFDGSAWVSSDLRANCQILESGQAFFVQATTTGAVLSFTENSKTNFQPGFISNFRAETTTQGLRISITSDDSYDVTSIYLSDEYKNSFEVGVDAIKFFTNSDNLYSLSSDDNVPLSINMVNAKDQGVLVPIHIELTHEKSVKIQIENVTSVAQVYQVGLLNGMDTIWLSQDFTLQKNDFDRGMTASLQLFIRKKYNYESVVKNIEEPVYLATSSYVQQQNELLSSVQDMEKIHKAKLYPNPLSNECLNLFSTYETYSDGLIQVYDTHGSSLEIWKFSASGLENIATLCEAKKLPKGVYFLRVIIGSYIETLKLIKK